MKQNLLLISMLLGNLEGSQVFDNIDGGVGHVTAVANQRLVIRFYDIQ